MAAPISLEQRDTSETTELILASVDFSSSVRFIPSCTVVVQLSMLRTDLLT